MRLCVFGEKVFFPTMSVNQAASLPRIEWKKLETVKWQGTNKLEALRCFILMQTELCLYPETRIG